MAVKVAIVYYSSTGTTYELAKAIEEGAKEAGAETKVLKAKETAPQQAIESNEKWKNFLEETSDVPEVSLDDLEWADAIIIGTPTRFGLPSSQMKSFLDTTGGLWQKGALVNKIGSSFTSAATKHGGHEQTILAMNTQFYHWGMLIVSPGYTDAVKFEAGSPYGATFTSQNGALEPDETALKSARFQGKRVTEVTKQFVKGKEEN